MVANNCHLADQGFKKIPDPALSTRFGGNGFVVFFGLAKPVRPPLVSPPRAPQSRSTEGHLLSVVEMVRQGAAFATVGA